MPRVYFSHLEVPADFARKKKFYLGLDIKDKFEEKKNHIFTVWRFKNYPLQMVLPSLFTKEVMKSCIRAVKS